MRLVPLVICAFIFAIASACGDSSDDGDTPPTAASRVATSASSPSPTSNEVVGIVAIGHSGLTGYASNPDRPDSDAKSNSWATGANPDVDSIYQRLVAAAPATEGHVANTAESGSEAAVLASQARAALAQVPKPQLAIIVSIDNDVRCDGTDPAHVPEYGAQITDALNVIAEASPDTKILLLSSMGRPATFAAAVGQSPEATQANSGDGPCDILDAVGMPADSRIALLTQIIEGYEAEQVRDCAEVPQCHTDGGAFSAYVDDLEGLAAGDWGHLSIAGQARAAELMWPTVVEILGLSD